jgi:uncharacterized membrane protein YebE (DUF533 family)
MDDLEKVLVTLGFLGFFGFLGFLAYLAYANKQPQTQPSQTYIPISEIQEAKKAIREYKYG